MADIRGVAGTSDGSYLSGSVVETALMPAGTNPTVIISSPFIRSANDVFHLSWQGDPGAAAPLVITAVTLAADQTPAKQISNPKPGTITIKAYGTTTAATKVALLINTIRDQNKPVFQTHKVQN